MWNFALHSSSGIKSINGCWNRSLRSSLLPYSRLCRRMARRIDSCLKTHHSLPPPPLTREILWNSATRLEKIPDPRRPYFKVRVVLNAVHCLCGKLQYDDTCLWVPAMFKFVTRRLFDTMDPALGSLSACAVVWNICLLVCLANPRSTDGYPLEMAIHGLRPYIVEAHCAEDAVGLCSICSIKGKDICLLNQPSWSERSCPYSLPYGHFFLLPRDKGIPRCN